jgi:hypothetical protein
MKNNFTIPYGTIPKITLDDIQAGYITRYFLQILSNKIVLEIDKTQYDRFGKNSLYTVISLKWYINGKLEDTTSPNGLVKGVLSKNSAVLDYYKAIIPELTYIIRSNTQYVIGVDNSTE